MQRVHRRQDNSQSWSARRRQRKISIVYWHMRVGEFGISRTGTLRKHPQVVLWIMREPSYVRTRPAGYRNPCRRNITPCAAAAGGDTHPAVAAAPGRLWSGSGISTPPHDRCRGDLLHLTGRQSHRQRRHRHASALWSSRDPSGNNIGLSSFWARHRLA